MRKSVLIFISLIFTSQICVSQTGKLNKNNEELRKKFISILKQDRHSARWTAENLEKEDFSITEENIKKEEEQRKRILEIRKKLYESLRQKGLLKSKTGKSFGKQDRTCSEVMKFCTTSLSMSSPRSTRVT